MDCCNYLPYRQPYYGGAYYDHLSYPGDFYGHPYHEYGYGSSPYYAQPWACAAPIPDYVYNPKEARIRKAMREASRDNRGLGSTSMTGARNSGRRPPAWMPAPEDPLMMTPPQTLRGPMPSPICTSNFPMPSEPSPFMSMNAYNKVGHILPPSSDSIHSSNTYMQTMQQNAMVNMQHEPNLWQGYQDVMNSRPSNGYMLPELPNYQQQLQEQQSRENPNIAAAADIKPQVEPQNFRNTATLPTEEKIAKDNEHNIDQKPLIGDSLYRTKIEIDEMTQGMIGEETMQNPEQYLPVYNESHYNEEIKLKKSVVSHNIKHKNSNNITPQKPSSKPLPDFNEAFGSTERGRFQSPPDPRLGPNKGYLDYFFDNNTMKYSDFQI